MSTQVRERAARTEVRRIVVRKMPFGLKLGELIGVLIAVVAMLWVATQYFSSLRPEQDRLRRIEAELDAQQLNMIASGTALGDQPIPEDRAKAALETLETFKSASLKSFSSGRIALIKEINALAKKNSVTLTSGIDMGASSGEAESEGAKTDETKTTTKRKKADDLLNTFPSVSFRFTVFGQYSSVRTFINEVEREKQFVVINSINLTNQEAKSASRRSRGGEGTTGVMLSIEMTAYFQPM